MSRAIELAALGEGMTRPNPPVGAVLVKNGRVVGEGWHRKAGKPHAEVEALKRAGARARGSTLYVTLEPCCTSGRTPPCTDAIIRNGIRRVVVGVRDPNPAHAGKGLALLTERGIEVAEGVCESEAWRLIEPFACWILTGEPYVTLKIGMSVDGRIADRKGASRWITGPESRAKVQAMRRRADAVMVGKGTFCADDPRLVPVPAKGRRPLRVIVAGSGVLPLKSQALNDEHVGETVIVVAKDCPEDRRKRIEAKGARVIEVKSDSAGRLSLKQLMKRLGEMGVLHVLCEGGGELAASLVRENLVDEFAFFVAPRLIGGATAPGAVMGRGWLLDKSPELRFVSAEAIGRDLMVMAKPVCECAECSQA